MIDDYTSAPRTCAGRSRVRVPTPASAAVASALTSDSEPITTGLRWDAALVDRTRTEDAMNDATWSSLRECHAETDGSVELADPIRGAMPLTVFHKAEAGKEEG